MPTPVKYDDLNFKIPQEAADYAECSDFAIAAIQAIMEGAIKSGNNKILINTNLKLGLPMENINKVAGPFVEAWVALHARHGKDKRFFSPARRHTFFYQVRRF